MYKLKRSLSENPARAAGGSYSPRYGRNSNAPAKANNITDGNMSDGYDPTGTSAAAERDNFSSKLNDPDSVIPGKGDGKGANGGSKKGGKTDVEVQQSREGVFKKYVPDGSTLFGIAMVGYVTYCGLKLDATDGVTVNITELKVTSNTATTTTIEVSYASDDPLFDPCPGDAIVFSSDTPVPLAGITQNITKVVGDRTLQIIVGSSSPILGFGDTPIPDLTTGKLGSITCHSSFENQFTDTAAGIIDQTINLAKNALLAGMSAAAEVGAGAGNALCKTAPFLCNWITWLAVGGGIFFIIILFLLLK
jgi:hypothetical protein